MRTGTTKDQSWHLENPLKPISQREPGMIPFIFSHCFRGQKKIVRSYVSSCRQYQNLLACRAFYPSYLRPYLAESIGNKFPRSLSDLRIFFKSVYTDLLQEFLVAIWPNTSLLLFICNFPLPVHSVSWSQQNWTRHQDCVRTLSNSICFSILLKQNIFSRSMHWYIRLCAFCFLIYWPWPTEQFGYHSRDLDCTGQHFSFCVFALQMLSLTVK